MSITNISLPTVATVVKYRINTVAHSRSYGSVVPNENKHNTRMRFAFGSHHHVVTRAPHNETGIRKRVGGIPEGIELVQNCSTLYHVCYLLSTTDFFGGWRQGRLRH